MNLEKPLMQHEADISTIASLLIHLFRCDILATIEEREALTSLPFFHDYNLSLIEIDEPCIIDANEDMARTLASQIMASDKSTQLKLMSLMYRYHPHENTPSVQQEHPI